MISVEDLNRNSLRAFVVEKGKITKNLKPHYTDLKNKSALSVRGEQCEYVTYKCNCGQVCVGGNCGEPECSTCGFWLCWDDGGGDDGGGGNDDPCVIDPVGCGNCPGMPNCPPDYGDNGGGSDPCLGPNPPANCGCNCSNNEVVVTGPTMEFSSSTIANPAYLSLSANFSVADCSVPSYTLTQIVLPNFTNARGGSFDTDFNDIVSSPAIQIDKDNPKCGFIVHHRIFGSVNWSGNDIHGHSANITQYYNQLVGPVLN